jgi:phosphonate transport system ATP-binding protein
VAATGVWLRYGDRAAVADVCLTIATGERVAIVGPSGAGKSSLLRLVCGAEPPSAGAIRLFDQDLARLRPGKGLARLVGLLHQQLDLVPQLTALHNALAGRLGEWSLARSALSLVYPQDASLGMAALRRVGMAGREHDRVARLSGGEQQRVAIARLLVQNPRILLADEPISNLDPARADDVLGLLAGLAREDGRTLVASMHSVDHALRWFDRVVALRDGRVVWDKPSAEVDSASLAQLYRLGAE